MNNNSTNMQQQLARRIARRKTVRGIIFTILGATSWAFSSGCTQYLTQSKNVSAEWLAGTRIVIAGVILTLIGWRQNTKGIKELFKNKKDLLMLILYGILGLMTAQFTFIMAVSASNAGTATVLQYTGPIMIIIYVCIKNLRLPSWTEAVSIVLAVTGVFLLATHGDLAGLSIKPEALIFGLLSAFGLVFYSLLPAKIIPKYGSVLITGLGMLVGGIAMQPLARPWEYHIDFDLMTVLAFLGVAIIGTAAGYTLYMQGVSDIGSVKTSMIASIEPVTSTVFAAILGTKFVWWQDYAGILCIVATIFILSIPTKDVTVSIKPSAKKES